ncbi:hypothetical protein GCM10010306_102310 [Streptomyces umbrinus]|nr:hypothetical protein GCM10010306_102310 [Streptomyces umbrinus]
MITVCDSRFPPPQSNRNPPTGGWTPAGQGSTGSEPHDACWHRCTSESFGGANQEAWLFTEAVHRSGSPEWFVQAFVQAGQRPARVNVTCVTPLGEEVASTS